MASTWFLTNPPTLVPQTSVVVEQQANSPNFGPLHPFPHMPEGSQSQGKEQSPEVT